MTKQAIDQAVALGPIRSRALPDDVYDVLLDMLTWGELKPGSPLAIDGLARSLGVSPTPIREALARLEHTGLVRRSARRGYRVSPLMTPEQMAELADARLVLETGAIERAMKNVDQLLPDLEEAFARHQEAARAVSEPQSGLTHENLRRYFEEDWSFHQAILDHCGNRYIERSVNSLSFSVHRMRQTTGLGTTDAPIAVDEHERILLAVRNNDSDMAVSQMYYHLANVGSRSAFRSGPSDTRGIPIHSGTREQTT